MLEPASHFLLALTGHCGYDVQYQERSGDFIMYSLVVLHPLPGGQFSGVNAISRRGRLAGWSLGYPFPRAVVWDLTKGPIDLGGSEKDSWEAIDINVQGQVVGKSTFYTGFRWTPPTPFDTFGF